MHLPRRPQRSRHGQGSRGRRITERGRSQPRHRPRRPRLPDQPPAPPGPL